MFAKLIMKLGFNNPVPIEPTMTITLKAISPANVALLERASIAANYGHPLTISAQPYLVVFIRMNNEGNPEIGLKELK